MENIELHNHGNMLIYAKEFLRHTPWKVSTKTQDGLTGSGSLLLEGTSKKILVNYKLPRNTTEVKNELINLIEGL